MWGYKAKIDQADKYFSLYIRARDGKCMECGRPGKPNKDGAPVLGLQNSHYWGRGKESTRFDPDNCKALCAYCHNRIGHGDGRDDYRELMIKLLGEKRYKTLKLQAHSYKKKDRKMEAMIWKQAYIKLLEEMDKKTKI